MTDFIGIDGGGTGCRVAIADRAGRVVGAATGGPANATSDFAAALRHVSEALEAARLKAGRSLSDLRRASAHVGLAGILTAEDAARIADALPIDAVRVTDDRPTNVAGALGARDGLVLAIGTGSFVAASVAGHMRFIGGWGLRLGDQASGAWLGRALLEQTLLVHDGIAAASPLSDSVLEGFGGDPKALVEFATKAAPQDFAAFAPRIAKAAAAGDTGATDLMTKGAAYLNRAIDRLDPGKKSAICLLGGVGAQYAAWLDPGCQGRLMPPEGDALDGALALARQHCKGVK